MLLRQEERKVPLRTYTLLALTTVATMGFSNASLGYLNYPTQVIFKCCKLIPVLVGGILIQGKRYGVMDFTAAGGGTFSSDGRNQVDEMLIFSHCRFHVPWTDLLHPRRQQVVAQF